MRLIDLDSEYIQETLYRRGFKTRQDIEDWLNSAPTIDAVPVVRCKDCIYKEPSCRISGWFYCNETGHDNEPDYFCADGDCENE